MKYNPSAPSLEGTEHPPRICRFHCYELDLVAFELRRAGERVPLAAQGVSILAHLVRNHARTVSRHELTASTWGAVKVSEGALNQAIWEVRQALAEDADEPRFLKTVRGIGYRFIAQVSFEEAAPVCPPTTRKGGPLLLGREEALDRLSTALDAARAQGCAGAITGPAGIGKSTLAQALVERARERGFLCFETHADASAPPFWPWLRLLVRLLDAADAPTRASCEALAPTLVKGLAELGEPGETPFEVMCAGPERQRVFLFDQMARLFTILSRAQPCLLLFEDLPVADEGSLAFLRHFGRALGEGRLLLLVTARTDEAGEASAAARIVQQLARATRSVHVVLSPLSKHDVGRLLADHACHELASTTEGIDALYALTRGNPLFSLELGRLLSASKVAARHELWGAAHGEVLRVIQRRVSMLSELVQQALKAAAVWGSELSLPGLMAVMDARSETALMGLDGCVEAGLLRESDDGHFRFAHALMREAAYRSLSRHERCALHLRAGRWLERAGTGRSASRLSELAHHYYHAAPLGEARKAIDYARRCAEHALRATAFVSAATYAERALQCAAMASDCTALEQLELALLRAEAERGRGAPAAEVNAMYLGLSERARELRATRSQALAALGYAGHSVQWFTAPRLAPLRDAQELSLLEQALSSLGEDEPELRAHLLCSLAHALLETRDRVRPRALLKEALEIARGLQQPWLLARVLSFEIVSSNGPDTAEASLASCEELLQLTRRNQLPEMEAEAELGRWLCLFRIGDAARVSEASQRLRHVAQGEGSVVSRSRAVVPALLQALCRGHLDEAERLSRRAYEASPHNVNQRFSYMMRMNAIALLREGIVEQAVSLYETMSSTFANIPAMRCLLASAYASARRFDAAELLFDSLARDDFAELPEDYTWLPVMGLLADAANRLNDAGRARLVYDRLSPYGDQFAFFGGEVCPAGPVAYWLGDLATTLGELEKARSWLHRARAMNHKMDAPMLQQYVTLADARLVATRDRARGSRAAGALINEVKSFAEQRGLMLLLRTSRELEEQLASFGVEEEGRSTPAARHARPSPAH